MTQDDRFALDGDFLVKSLCGFCIHAHSGAATCDAYPDGIPDGFLDGDEQHTAETVGDNGIFFELNEQYRTIAEAWTGLTFPKPS